MSEAAQILEAALKLDEVARADLVLELSRSLYAKSLGPDWECEIAARAEDIDVGRVQLEEGDAVLDRLEKRFGSG